AREGGPKSANERSRSPSRLTTRRTIASRFARPHTRSVVSEDPRGIGPPVLITLTGPDWTSRPTVIGRPGPDPVTGRCRHGRSRETEWVLRYEPATGRAVFREYCCPTSGQGTRRFDDVCDESAALELVRCTPKTVIARGQSYRPTQRARGCPFSRHEVGIGCTGRSPVPDMHAAAARQAGGASSRIGAPPCWRRGTGQPSGPVTLPRSVSTPRCR